MVEYFPVINRAVEALNPNTPETRRALYDRARRALIDGLRSSDPTLSDTDLKTQSNALEGAIRQVESQFEVEALRGVAHPTGGKAYALPQADARTPPPVDAESPAPQAAEETEETYEDRPALDDERKPFRLIAIGLSVLVLLLGAAAAYTYWPSLSPIRTATPPAQRAAPGKRIEPDAGSAGYVFLRQPVYYRSNHPVGTIVVDKSQSFLYVVRPSMSAIRYGIAVGPECNAAAGLYQIVRKEEWPGFKTPAGGKISDDERAKNPMGARALYLSKESHIHGTNTPNSIGKPAPAGCIRLTNDDVIYLYDRSPLETRVIVQ
jgi:lipoprotein-anchoring transpeptidase ErfK/SrfK